ncbi:hypothetical protein BGZ46_002448 [Entomortierella lignicola]|nr:hypothetical protein BGZ46_002448 [Entomortierella lignicola]
MTLSWSQADMSKYTFDPSHPPKKALSGSDTASFGYTTLQSRLPVIVSKVVDDVYRSYHNLPNSDPLKEQKDKEAKQIIEAIGGLRYELQRDKPFRRVKEAFALTQHWRDYDPFFEQKQTVFKSSQKAVAAIAVQLMSPAQNNNSNDNDSSVQSLSSLDILVSQGPESVGTREAFFELSQICLWGNATDLSLLDNPDLAKVEDLQKRVMMGSSRSATPSNDLDKQIQEQIKNEHQQRDEPSELEKHAEKILQNDSELLWEKIKTIRDGRVDIILDNAGFELYVDLVFADYLIRAGFASKVVFHSKRIPWFVSDVLPFDFQWSVDQLHKVNDNSSPFFDPSDPTEQKAIKDLGQKWQSYIDRGVWKVVTHDFWTSCYSFYHLPLLPWTQDLFQDMKQSDLWIFKGDLNYRKLVYDCQWPTTTSFKEAIGPLANRDVPSLVTFRTCKADVVVGLKDGVEERMNKATNDWMFSGEYAVISFCD